MAQDKLDKKLRDILVDVHQSGNRRECISWDKTIMDIKILFADEELERFEQAEVSKRKENLETSSQLTLGELIGRLEEIPNKDLPVSFDGSRYSPSGLGSWRWVYDELAIEYSSDVKVPLSDVLKMLKGGIGKSYEGWKGGLYQMGLDTPLWVASHGENEGFKRNEQGDKQAVTGVLWSDRDVIIDTDYLEY